MASDEDGSQQEVRISSSNSTIGNLINRINKMSTTKNQEINLELNETLNTFLSHLNETQEYLENGIFNVKFAEAGLFLQSAANLYSKKVDSLWDSTLQYQMQLCTYSKAPGEKAEEAEKLTQRLNRNKRKKIIIKDVDTDRALFSDLEDKCAKVTEFLKNQCTLTHTLHNQDGVPLNNLNSDSQSLSSIDDTQESIGIKGFRMPVDCSVRNLETSEKLCNYNDLYLNCSVPYLDTTTVENNKFQIVNRQDDLLLQKYLNMKQISYKDFCIHDHGKDFEIFKQIIVQRDEVDVNVTIINSRSNDLFNSTLGENNLSIETAESIQKEKQLEVTGSIRKGSERISNADSLFPDEHYCTDTETDHCDTPYTTTQRSGADSGICCSDIPNISSIMEGQDEHLEEHLETGGYHADESVNEPNHAVNQCTENISKSDDISKSVEDLERIKNGENTTGKPQEIQSPSITIIQKTILKPMENINLDKLSLKRKLIKGEVEEGRKEKRRRSKRFKWLKGFTVSLHEYERFRKTHYQPEFGEGDISEISDDDDDDINNFIPIIVFEEQYERFHFENYSLLVQKTVINDDDCIENMAFFDNNDIIEYNRDSNEMMERSVISENLNNLPEEYASNRVMDIEGVSTVPEDDAESLHDIIVADEAEECNTSVLIINNVQENIEDAVGESLSRQCIPRMQSSESESNRVKVVTEWKRFIEPRLQQAEKNSQFDIHQYGTFIMDSIPPDENLAFKDIAKGKPASEVTRLFLAALQLANTSNVELIVPSQETLVNDTLQMKLLTRERYHEHLLDFEAPSENVFRSNLARMQATRTVPLHSTPKSKHKKQRVR